jgi:hypothetical protein
LWLREAKLAKSFPPLRNINGGVAFTHPRATYRIPRETPFHWGDITYWTRHLAQTRAIPGMNQRIALRVIDALLKRHREISNDRETHSMDAAARQLIQQTEARLKAWIQEAS